MNLRRIRFFFLVTLVEAILALIVILRPQTLSNNLRLGFSTSQALTGAPFIFIVILFGWFCFKAFTDEPWLEAASSFFSRVASQQASLPALAWLIVWLVIINAAILSGTAQSVSVRLPVIFQVAIQRSAPPLVWLILAAIQLYILLFYPASRALKAFVKPILISAIILVFLGLYVQGAVIQLEVVNIKLRLTDQSDYMNEAKKMVASHYTYSGARNRMPIYPFIQSLFYRPSMTNSEFFTQGKYLNLVLSVLILAFIAGIFFHYFNPYHTMNMMLLVSFMVFMFKAGYFQSELLFYFFTFLMFFLMWRFFTQPSIKVAICIGVVAGLGHLTKASILPGLFVFIIFAALQYGWRLLQRLRAQPRSYSGEILKPMLTIPLVALLFLITVFPYINTSKRIYGQYFYNVNSTFYFWYDSWEQAEQGTKAAGDRQGWPKIPADQIPSMGKYLREHSMNLIALRLSNGGRAVISNLRHSFGYFNYIALYISLLLISGVIYWRKTRDFLLKFPFQWLFILAYFGLYFLLYAWYVPITSGARLILSQLIPLLFIISVGLQALLGNSTIKLKGRSINLLTLISLPITGAMIFTIYAIFVSRIGAMYGGH